MYTASREGIIKLAPSKSTSNINAAPKLPTVKHPEQYLDDNGEERVLPEDRDDLLFSMRRDQQRISQMFPHCKVDRSTIENAFDRNMLQLDAHELRVAKNIIERENLAAKSTTIDNINLKKRSLMEVSSSEMNAPKRPLSSTSTASNNAGNSILNKLYQSDRINAPNYSITSSSALGINKAVVNQRWQGVETKKMIGNSIVDMKSLLQNAPVVQQNKPSSAAAHNMAKKVVEAKEAKLLSEVDELLSRKSTHNQEANEEWFESYTQKCDRLAKQEYVAEKKAAVTHFTIQAWECITCAHFLTELLPGLCKSQGHQIRSITAIKRLFTCRNCSRRDSTLTKETMDQNRALCMPPSRRCKHCNAYDWMAPVAGNSSSTTQTKHDTQLHDVKLIASASEWTTSREKLSMASRVSNLK